jgi:hypothetical protein
MDPKARGLMSHAVHVEGVKPYRSCHEWARLVEKSEDACSKP